MKTPASVPFFLAVGVLPAYALLGLAAVLAIAVLTVLLDPSQLDQGLAMILFVQMFLASTGFLKRARRGHFDPLLVDRERRFPIVAAHCAVSVAPGLLAWFAFSATAAAAGNPIAMSALFGARAVAILIVSALAWSVGFAFPRGAAGAIWLALFVFIVTMRGSVEGMGHAVGAFMSAAMTVLVCPFVLLGLRHLATSAICVALTAALAVLAGVCWYAERLDCSLVDCSS
jgi:hypothetical protein